MNSLPEAHLVSKNSVGVLGPGEPQPVQALQLVGVEGAPCLSDTARLLLILTDRLGTGERICWTTSEASMNY